MTDGPMEVMDVDTAFGYLPSRIGTTIELAGRVCMKGARCWFVPRHAILSDLSQEEGVLIRQPGIAVLLRSAPIKAGGEVAVIEEVIASGTLSHSETPPFQYELHDLNRLKFVDDGEPQSVDLDLRSYLIEVEENARISYPRLHEREQVVQELRRRCFAW